MSAAWALFTVGAVLAVLTVPALSPMRHWAFLFPAFFVAWLGSSLAMWWLVLAAGGLAALVTHGGLDAWPGFVGLALGAVAISGLAWQAAMARRGARVFDAVMTSLDGRRVRRVRRRPASVLLPFWMADARVERISDLRYAEGAGRRHLLDVYRARTGAHGAPVLLQIHGGAWMVGNKRTQGRPLMNAMARAGWVCVAPNYRLSPRSKWPDHLVDCKLALTWVREHIAEYGGDPARVVVTGGSAGGHLAAMVALTPDDKRFQPGFESADTSVVGCAAMYGAYDLGELFSSPRRIGRWVGGETGRFVMGVPLRGHEQQYDDASPIHRMHGGAPPFLVVHGTVDNLVPVEQARRLVTNLRSAGVRVCYVELPGAPHAFDVFHSNWADGAVEGVARWLNWLLDDHGDGPAGADSASTDPKTMAHTAPS
jgi:acetyl esterase/lipase